MTLLFLAETINPVGNLEQTILIGCFCQVSYVLDVEIEHVLFHRLDMGVFKHAWHTDLHLTTLISVHI